VEEARLVFEERMTRSGNMRSFEQAMRNSLLPGHFTPYWENHSRSGGSNSLRINVPILGTYYSYAYVAPSVCLDCDGECEHPFREGWTSLAENRLVVVKFLTGEETTPYIQTIIPMGPSRGQAKARKRDKEPLRDLTGIVQYHDLDGKLIKTNLYENGEILIGAYYQESDYHEKLSLIESKVGRVQSTTYESVQTRSIEIPPVTVIYCRQCGCSECGSCLANCSALRVGCKCSCQNSSGGGSTSPPPTNPGGGSSGGGTPGGSIPDPDNQPNPNIGQNEVPNAYPLFQSSTLTTAQWRAFETELNRIIADCMGQKLYNEVLRSMNGLKITLNYNPSYVAGQLTGTVSRPQMNFGIMEDHVILHELVHVYQVKNGSSTATINKEIEAFYLQYKYLKNSDRFLPGKRWYLYFNENELGRAVAAIEYYLDINCKLIRQEDMDAFQKKLDKAAEAFQRTREYRNCPYLQTLKGLDNFQAGINLTKDCKNEEF